MKALKLSLVACALMGSAAFAGTDDPALDLLIEKLVEKGALKIEDAADVTAEMKKAVAERNKTLAKDKDFVKELMGKNISVTSKAKKIEFSGTHYFGLTSNTYGDRDYYGAKNSTGFEVRRNYIQAKAYLNDKDYFRVTFDTIKELESTPTSSGQATGNSTAFVKYAYLWLDKVLPYTGAEIGIAHRPWIDYEEHNAWYYRSFNKVAVEDKFSTQYTSAITTTVGPDIINSADLGVNLKTKTTYFTSEIGVFNGEGYHADKAAANQAGSGDLSFEWRLTGHLLGDGETVGKNDRTKAEYAHVSFAGMKSKNHKDSDLNVNDKYEYDRTWMMAHAVYNHPMFLVSAQYSKVNNDLQNPSEPGMYDTEMKVWSINGEIRPVKDWTIIARYDNLDTKYKNANASTTTADSLKNDKNVGDATQMILALAYNYSKNVTFIGSYKKVDAKDTSPATGNYTGATATTVGDMLDKSTVMFTTEVKW